MKGKESKQDGGWGVIRVLFPLARPPRAVEEMAYGSKVLTRKQDNANDC